jgi:hypothetical protein
MRPERGYSNEKARRRHAGSPVHPSTVEICLAGPATSYSKSSWAASRRSLTFANDQRRPTKRNRQSQPSILIFYSESGSILATAAFSSTCAGVFIPTRAQVIPGVLRAN